LMAAAGQLDVDRRLDYVLAGGDDYELAFTAPPAQREAVQAAAKKSDAAVTRIGQIESAAGIRLLDGQGRLVQKHYGSFDHFVSP
jgi:thiamine-monophosphate kinase